MPNSHKAFLVAETAVVQSGMQDALDYIMKSPERDHTQWLVDRVFHQSDAETLIEFMGRLCYKSFEVGLNPNVTKIRDNIHDYIGNILKVKHGSVVEHATTTFALCNVSRIFTHELVRHRAGTAFSQESQRFVRLDDFQLYIPDLTESLHELYNIKTHNGGFALLDDKSDPAVILSPEQWVQDHQDEFIRMSERIKEVTKREMAIYLHSIGLDAEGVSFHVKKSITSALRRLLPGGVNTNIGLTANHRTWRHLIANRTAFGAEVEIREVFVDIARQLAGRYPHLYQDMQEVANENGVLHQIPEVRFLHEKI